MLYVYHGTNIDSSRVKAHTLIHGLREKRPDATFEEMTAETWDFSTLLGHLGGQGLFSNKYIIFLNRISENEEAREKLLELISSLNESSNIFIALEGELNKDLAKAFTDGAKQVVVSDLKAVSAQAGKWGNKGGGSGGKADFNIFALGNALGSRDALKAWQLYRQAVDGGLELENIMGTLFWQVKSMVVAAGSSSASSSGLSPFVYSSAKKYAGMYSSVELDQLLESLVSLYHEGHRGTIDMELALEQLLLNCARPKL